MRIIVFSDSHGRADAMRRVLQMSRDADLVLHLGDGVREFEALRKEFPYFGFISVPGNFEDLLSVSSVGTLTFEAAGKRLMLTHGHAYGVKSGTERLISAARTRSADAVLFGHTHERYLEYVPAEQEDGSPLWLFNPGSISRPSHGAPSFGSIEIRESGMLFSHGDAPEF